MGTTTRIAWTDHTFNPWRGCVAVSPGCAHCYAETLSKRNPRTLGVWGRAGVGTRVVAAEAYWREPLRWNAAAAAAGVRRRVFCASLADVFEDWQGRLVSPRGGERMRGPAGQTTVAISAGRANGGWRAETLDDVRRRLFVLIAETPWLDWQLLTKRPENIRRMLEGHVVATLPNLWIGTTVEDQARADARIPHLLAAPAAVRFLSLEPLLERVDLRPYVGGFERVEAAEDCDEFDLCIRCGEGFTEQDRGDRARAREGHRCPPGFGPGIDWLIVGGESGPGARGFDVAWPRHVLRQGREAGVAVFVKQFGARPFDGEDPDHDPNGADEPRWLRLRDRQGSDPSEWPEDLRVQEFPTPRAGGAT